MKSESHGKQIKAIWAVLAMLTIWQVSTTVKVNLLLQSLNSISDTVDVMIEKVRGLENVEEEIEEGIETYEEIYKEQIGALESFNKKFCRMRSVHGSGHLFNWQGNLYTTYYAEEIVTFND